jgi:hypothetical protein
MPSRTKLKHIFVFAFAFALLGIVPMTLMHVLTNAIDTMLIQSDAVRALLIISPMMSCMAGIAIAVLYVVKHPELL